MDFFGIGLPEIILILIVAVIVVGPKRLPEVAAQVARVVRQLRGYATDVTSQMRQELDELTREYEAMRKELEEVKQSATQDVQSVTREVDRDVRRVGRAVRDLPPIVESSGTPVPPKVGPTGPTGPSGHDA